MTAKKKVFKDTIAPIDTLEVTAWEEKIEFEIDMNYTEENTFLYLSYEDTLELIAFLASAVAKRGLQ